MGEEQISTEEVQEHQWVEYNSTLRTKLCIKSAFEDKPQVVPALHKVEQKLAERVKQKQ